MSNHTSSMFNSMSDWSRSTGSEGSLNNLSNSISSLKKPRKQPRKSPDNVKHPQEQKVDLPTELDNLKLDTKTIAFSIPKDKANVDISKPVSISSSNPFPYFVKTMSTNAKILGTNPISVIIKPFSKEQYMVTYSSEDAVCNQFTGPLKRRDFIIFNCLPLQSNKQMSIEEAKALYKQKKTTCAKLYLSVRYVLECYKELTEEEYELSRDGIELKPEKVELQQNKVKTESSGKLTVTNIATVRIVWQLVCRKNEVFTFEPAEGILDSGEEAKVLINYTGCVSEDQCLKFKIRFATAPETLKVFRESKISYAKASFQKFVLVCISLHKD